MAKASGEEPKSPAAEAGKAPSGKASGVRARLGEAYNAYLAALRELQSDNYRASEEAYRNYAGAVHACGATFQSRSQEAYNHYLTLLQQVQSAGGTETSTSVYNRYLENLNAIRADWCQCTEDTYREYLEVLEKIQSGDAAEGRLAAAYGSYIKAIKEVSANLDPASTSLGDLSAITQNIAAAVGVGQAGEVIVRSQRIRAAWLTRAGKCAAESSGSAAAS
jgi:hypothetical protein